METYSSLELGNGDQFRPGTWKWRPIPAWNLEMETDSGLKLGNGDRRPRTWKWRPIDLDTSKQILSSGGVSLLIGNSFASHVQDFKSHSSCLLSIDLYFKGNVKLRIFVVYIPPPAKKVLRSDTIDLLIQQLILTKQAGFYHAVCGNFNMHLDKYYPIYFNQLQLTSKHIHRLFYHLLSHGYEDYTPINLSNSLGFAFTTCIFDAQDICTPDHNPVITYYDMSLLFASTKLARARQLKRQTRCIFKFDSVTEFQ
ncbi:hypothetical protein RhiirB3_452276 [Rhizophagus irregularis]|nr:hypothetical protein RhiirB3_452276 [Rhizophagus irregularis]